MKTRFAPSPTGTLHIGGARTALINWLLARQAGGQFIVRSEDTDRVRNKPEYEKDILESLKWLGLYWDGDIVRQSSRTKRYQEVAQKLLQEGKAYYCYMSEDELKQERDHAKEKGVVWKYDYRYRNFTGTPPAGVAPVIRLKNPLDGATQWNDVVKGGISVENSQLDDLIILRSDGTPTYNFCVVVDDADMEITHVIRGDDHINNTPRQIRIYRAIGSKQPEFGHIPLILNPDGSKMSKSDQASSIGWHKERGILADTLNNYLMLITCQDGGDEVFLLHDFLARFNLANIGKSNAKYGDDKLLWLNAQHLRKMDDAQFSDWLGGDGLHLKKEILERARTREEAHNMIEATKQSNLGAAAQDPEARDMLCALLAAPYDWTHDTVLAGMKAHTTAKGEKFGVLAKKMRTLLGGDAGLPLSSVLAHLGKEKVHNVLLKHTPVGELYYKGENPTVDLAIFNDTGTHVLMIQRGRPPCQGYWALPGGFHDSDAKKGEVWLPGHESAEDAAWRELKEETGLDATAGAKLTFVQDIDNLLRDPRNNHEGKITTHLFAATLPMTDIKPIDTQGEVQQSEWKALDNLPELIGFDHRILIEKARNALFPSKKFAPK